MHYSLFTYFPETKSFVSDMSDLPILMVPSEFQLIGKENTVRFVLMNRTNDREGDIMSWDYKGSHDGVIYNARIFND